VDEVADDVGPRGEERVRIGGGGLDVGGVDAVGELEEEAVGGAKQGVGGGGRERGHDGGDLERRGAMLPGDPLVRVHRLQKPQQHPLRHRRHRSPPIGGGVWGGYVGERFGGRERKGEI
jgi:hypothetical protein